VFLIEREPAALGTAFFWDGASGLAFVWAGIGPSHDALDSR
jgi:hypothetical protein